MDWTVVRPPRLLNKPVTGTYRTALNANLRGGRADVTHAMLSFIGTCEGDSRAGRSSVSCGAGQGKPFCRLGGTAFITNRPPAVHKLRC
ncbi:hypothetical protein [Streptomyces sp. KR80]|uniref:hypothetical protein n=1 Tax=Streptomyces sp. KR80 TaxID=3457426 RepID=UPI003FD3CB10